jgi:hypothetical protein
MTQISRPFQIVLAAFALFVAVWFVALRAHNSSTTGGSSSGASSSSSATVTHPTSAAHAKVKTTATTTTTRVHHSANGAAVTVKRSVSSAAGHTTVRHTTAVHSNTTAGHTTVVRTTAVKHTPPAAKPVPAKTKPATGTPGMQIAVEHELQQGKTVLILFWNSKGADDVAVHNELPAVQRSLGGKVAVHYASANQVGEYGTITHAVQVNQTPTLLIVNPHGQTTTLTGLTDSFSIEQSISEANHS